VEEIYATPAKFLFRKWGGGGNVKKKEKIARAGDTRERANGNELANQKKKANNNRRDGNKTW
jgi:hypothetical protein